MIRIKDLSKCYRIGDEEVHALDHASLHVAPGEFADAVAWGVHRARRDARILHMGGAGPDHPLHPMLPESQYLKGMLLHLG